MKNYIFYAMAICLVPSMSSCEKTKPKHVVRNIAVHPEFFGDGKVECSGTKLVDDGFGGVLDQLVSIEHLGDIKSGAFNYSVYYYYRDGNHGTHIVIIMEDGCGYFGSYWVNDRPLRVSGQDVIFDAPVSSGNVIRFTGISPPARVVIDGEVEDFSR